MQIAQRTGNVVKMDREKLKTVGKIKYSNPLEIAQGIVWILLKNAKLTLRLCVSALATFGIQLTVQNFGLVQSF